MRRNHKNHIGRPCRPVFAFLFTLQYFLRDTARPTFRQCQRSSSNRLYKSTTSSREVRHLFFPRGEQKLKSYYRMGRESPRDHLLLESPINRQNRGTQVEVRNDPPFHFFVFSLISTSVNTTELRNYIMLSLPALLQRSTIIFLAKETYQRAIKKVAFLASLRNIRTCLCCLFPIIAKNKNRNTPVTTFQSTIHLLNNAIKLGSAVVNKIFLRDITVLDSFA